jgi:hypothetical protein
MDTLCVPATGGESKEKAIASVEKVYKKAMAVLVIDRDLLILVVSRPSRGR